MKFLQLTIEVLEDLHIGTGTGWGDIDSLQVRDRRGWPVLPASHIKGVLRETAMDWHRTDPSAISKAQIDHFFGRVGKGQGHLQLTSAYLNAEQKTLLWGSTQIDPTTGTAMEKSLRFVEYVPAGALFTIEARLSGDKAEDEKLLLSILARCPRLGAGRNRGQGQIRWELCDSENAGSPTALAPPTSFPARLRLILSNPDPLCLARTGNPGNVIATESFIRGRALRGAFTAACLAEEQPEVAQSLLDPLLSWGDALPLPSNTDTAQLSSLEVIPIPLSVGTPKKTAPNGEIPWWALSADERSYGARGEKDETTLKEEEKLKRPGDDYLFRSSETSPWQRYRPQILQRLHAGVPSAENNHEQALFSTEEIAEKTLFLSDMWVANPAQVNAINCLINTLNGAWLRMGRGGKPLMIKEAAWVPLSSKNASVKAENAFTLLLESDLVVRDEWGNFQDKLNVGTIKRLAGLADVDVVADKIFSEGVDVFGFNAATGLPRLAERAIKAGSVIKVEGIGAKKLRDALEKRRFLGECPEEGFGRFRLDQLPIPLKPTTTNPPKALETSHDEALCQEAKKWWGVFGNALNAPSSSQWGDFRGRVQASRSVDEIKAIFSNIDESAQKLGGKAWKSFVEHRDYQAFKDDLGKQKLADAQHLLEYFLRWQRAIAKAKEEQK